MIYSNKITTSNLTVSKNNNSNTNTHKDHKHNYMGQSNNYKNANII